jgi:hypothetical protein
MFYNNLYNRSSYGNCNGTGYNNGNGFGSGNYTFLLQSKVEHTVQVTTDPYNIQIASNDVATYSSITYIAQIPTTIVLPVMNDYINKVSINVINSSNGLVRINTQNGELMYNSSYLPPSGGTSINLTQNKFCKLILNKSENKVSYILLLT